MGHCGGLGGVKSNACAVLEISQGCLFCATFNLKTVFFLFFEARRKNSLVYIVRYILLLHVSYAYHYIVFGDVGGFFSLVAEAGNGDRERHFAFENKRGCPEKAVLSPALLVEYIYAAFFVALFEHRPAEFSANGLLLW